MPISRWLFRLPSGFISAGPPPAPSSAGGISLPKPVPLIELRRVKYDRRRPVGLDEPRRDEPNSPKQLRQLSPPSDPRRLNGIGLDGGGGGLNFAPLPEEDDNDIDETTMRSPSSSTQLSMVSSGELAQSGPCRTPQERRPCSVGP